jgi:peptide/nickel transport system permease protein
MIENELALNSKNIFKPNRRQSTFFITVAVLIFLLTIVAGGFLISDKNIETSLENKNLAPSATHPFGTDWLGRDMLARTLKGLTLSMGIGIIAAFASAIIALILGIAAATMGKYIDSGVMWLVDLFLGVPHLVIIILISFTLGGGLKGIIVGIAFTHWPSLARIIRAEILQLRSTEYVLISRKLGKSRLWITIKHILPHLVPQFFIGLLLLFPHAILHEAAISFLGFGLSPHQPAVGIILAESMRHLSTGRWWLAFFPGLSLLLAVRAFDILGNNMLLLSDPHRAHE